MKPRFNRIVDGLLMTGDEDEEKMVDGDRDEGGDARERG